MKLKKTLPLLMIGLALLATPNLAFADTTYDVPVSLMKADNPEKISVANNALNKTAKVIVKDDGTSEYTLTFVPMEMNGAKGNVTKIFLSDDGKKEVVLTAKGDNKDAKFTRKKAKEDNFKLAFWVDAMDKIMGGKPGAGEQEAILHVKWDDAKEVKNAAVPADKKVSEAAAKVSTPVGSEPIQIFLNGQKIIFDTNPIIQNGRTLVPVRAIFESLGATVKWDGATRTVSSEKDSHSLSLVIGQKNVIVDGKTVQLDVPATIINGRTLVPLRFISEAYGNKVDYNVVGKVAVIDIRA